MKLGTIWDLVALWFLISGLICLFGGHKIIIVIYVFIIASIIAGFFAGIGNQVLLFVLRGG